MVFQAGLLSAVPFFARRFPLQAYVMTEIRFKLEVLQDLNGFGYISQKILGTNTQNADNG